MKMITERLKFADVFPDKAAGVAQRLHIKKDEIPFVRKYYTAEKDKTEVKKKERAVVSYISTGIKDRDGEKLLPEGAILENYLKNPIVPFAHNYKSIPPAKNMWLKRDEKGLVAKTIFAKSKQAEEYYQAYSEDIGGTGPLLNAFSVGFIPLEWEDTEAKAMEKDPDLPKRIYNKWELLEYSLVPIPSCPEALTIAVEKGLISEKLQKELVIEVVKDITEKTKESTEGLVESMDRVLKGMKDGTIVLGKDEEDKEIEVEIISHPVAKATETPTTTSGEQEIEVEREMTKSLVDGIVKDTDEIMMKPITKPETTENYHRIPIESPDKHKGHRIRTITISASKGIKALYCGECKKAITYLFDVEKWTMAEAQTWVSEHKKGLERYEKLIGKNSTTANLRRLEAQGILKNEDKPQYKERWNKSFSKLFDIASAESSAPMRFHFDLYEKFLECKVKEVFQNSYQIPSPLLGSYLAGFKEILGKFDLKDTRRFSYAGDETPPNYEVINLNSEKTDDFLIDGMQFYEAEKRPLIVTYSPDWYGLTITLVTSNKNKEWNKDLLDKAHAWVKENNFLRGEKFALSGEFLDEPGDNWDNLILKDKYKDAIMTSAKALEKRGEKLVGRGLLFIGPPGTGKTKTGRVLMNELDATFIWISSRDFRHIGPMKALSLGFSMARDLAPSVLFLEDIDTWLRGEMEYVTDLLKTEMDGIKQNRGMVTIMTSNYPEKLPPALLDRPGRFHHIVNFELPDEKQRKEMIALWAGDVDEKLLNELGEKTDGFSGAHLKELVEFAKMIADEEEIEIGKAMLMSLDKLMEQRELIEEIRANQEEAKAVWGRLKYVDNEIKWWKDKEIYLSEKSEALRADESDELEVTKDSAIGEQQGEELETESTEFEEAVSHIRSQYEKIVLDKDFVIAELKDVIAELKEGRVLSRKHRDIVKAAITALSAVLKADATGEREDTEADGEGTVNEREREIDIIKDSEKELSKADITELIKTESGPALVEAMKQAIKENLDPKKLKEAMKDIARTELLRIRGKVV